MAEFVEIKNEDLDNLPIMSAEEAAEKGVTGYRTEEGGPLRISMPVGPTVAMPKPRPKDLVEQQQTEEKPVISEVKGTQQAQPKMFFSEPITKRAGIVLPKDAKPSGVDTRVPIGRDKGKRGRIQYGTLEEEIKTDIAEQLEPIPYEEFEKRVTSGEITRTNIGQEGTLGVLARMIQDEDLTEAQKDVARKKLDFIYKRSQYFDPSKKVPIEFAREGKFVPKADDNPIKTDSKRIQSETKLEFAKLLEGRLPAFVGEDQNKVKKALLDKVSVVSPIKIFIERLNEGGRAIPQLVPYGKYILDLFDTTNKYQEALKFGIDKTWGDIWAEGSAERDKTIEDMSRILQSELNMPLLSTVINEAVREEFKKQFDNKEIDEETFKRLTQITVDGTTVNREYVDEIMAMEILDLGMSMLKDKNKALMYVGEPLLQFTMGSGISRFVAQKVAKKEVKNFRKDQIDNYKKELDDKLQDQKDTTVTKKNYNKLLKGETNRINKMSDQELIYELEELDIIKRFDTRSLLAAEEIQIVKNNVKLIQKKSIELGKNLKKAKADPSVPKIKIKQMEDEYNKAHFRTVIDSLTLRNTPLLREGVIEVAPLAAFQYAGATVLADFFETDSMTGEAMGIAAYVFAGKPISFVAGRTANFLSKGGGGVANQFAKVTEGLASSVFGVPKGWLADRTIEEYEALLRRPLTFEEKRSLKYMEKLVDYMGPENAKLVEKQLRANHEKRDRLANLFPEGPKRKEVYESLSMYLGEATGIAWFRSAEELAKGNLGAFDPKNAKNIIESIELQKIQSKKMQVQEVILNRIEELSKGQGLDLRSKEKINNFLLEQRRNIDTIQKKNIIRAEELKNKTQLYLREFKSNPNSKTLANVPEELNEALLELNKSLNPNKSPIELLKDTNDQLNENFKGINRSFSVIKSNRDDLEKHSLQLNNQIEKLNTTHMSTYIDTARVKYTDLDAKMIKQGKFIDLKEEFFNLKNADEKFKDKTLAQFFSTESEFFNGHLNRKLKASFKKMISRSLDELPEELMSKLKELATTGSRETNPYFINSTGAFDNMDLALVYMKNNPNFNPLKATASELSDIYAAFRDYGYRIQDEKPDLARLYKGKADDIKQIFQEQNEDLFDEFEEVVSFYKASVFDRQDIDGDFNKIQKGIKRKPEIGVDTEFEYKKGSTPDILFDSTAQSLQEYASKGVNISKVKNTFQNTAREYMDVVVNENGKKDLVFDLTTEFGREKFMTFQNVLKEKMYNKWQSKFYKIYETPRTDLALEGRIASKKGGYNFDRSFNHTQLERLDEVFTVKVKTPQGVTINASVNPLPAIIDEQEDIIKLLQKDKGLQEKYNQYVDRLEDIMNSAKDVEIKNKQLQENVFGEISKIIGTNLNPSDEGILSFFNNHVEGRNLNYINNMKKMVKDKLKEAGKADDKGVDDIFKFLITNGVVQKGGVSYDGGRRFLKVDGTRSTHKTLKEPEKIVAMFDKDENPQVAEILDDVMNPRHRQAFKDLAEYLNDSRKAEFDLDAKYIGKGLRPISDNELVSRAYNVARGMVSPLYVSTEFALRIASQSGIQIMNLAATSDEAAILIEKLVNRPRTINAENLKKIDELVTNFVAAQLTRLGEPIPKFTQEGVERFEQEKGEEIETVQ